MDMSRIAPGCDAGEMGSHDGDLCPLDANAVNFFEEFRYVGDVLNDIVHPDFIHRIVIEGKVIVQIGNHIHSFAFESVDSHESFFPLIATTKIQFHSLKHKSKGQ